MWVEIDGKKHNLLHYFIPHPQLATGVPIAVELAGARRKRA
jgi:hypothetical protein